MKINTVGTMDRIINIFSENGRIRNGIYTMLDTLGMNRIEEVKLPDKSRVIAAYKTRISDVPKYVYKVNKDGSVFQKTNMVIAADAYRNQEGRNILKTYMDAQGNIFKSDLKIIKTKDSKIQNITRRIDYPDYSLDIVYDAEGNANITDGGVSQAVKSVVKTSKNNKDSYVYFEDKDGTKTFIKNINGVNYTFTNAK